MTQRIHCFWKPWRAKWLERGMALYMLTSQLFVVTIVNVDSRTKFVAQLLKPSNVLHFLDLVSVLQKVIKPVCSLPNCYSRLVYVVQLFSI